MNQKILSRLSAVCACGLAVFAAGCSPEWIAGEAPDTPPGAFKADPVVPESKTGNLTAADYSDAQFASLPSPALAPADNSSDLAGFTLKDSPTAPAPTVKAPSATLSAPAAAPAAAPVKSQPGTAAASPTDIKYVVQVNDTLSGIAYIYGVPVDELAAHNGLTAKSTIKPNQVLYIPTDRISSQGTQTVDQVKASGFQPLDKTAAASGANAAAAAAGGAITYTVVAGDSLGKIGQKFHVNYMKIAKANNMDPNAKLYVGKKLIIPDAKAAPDAAKATASKKKTKSTASKSASAAKTAPAADVKAADNGSDAVAAAEPAAEKKAKTDEPSDADVFGDEAATSADTPASAAAPAAPAAAEPAAREAVAEKAPENAEPEAPQGPADPPDIFQYNLTSESTLKSICKSMHYREDTILKLNPGISIDERLGAGRSITLPMIPDDL